ncbi:hypothetical protein ACWD48_10905 [Streptomyces sp. NPDC002519]
MGIESDQLVFDYLSRVGDVAQQHQLPSAARMRLVSGLREEIDRRRAKAPVDSPAAVRRILARLGTPDEVVTAASEDTAGGGAAPSRSVTVPTQRTNGVEDLDRPRGLRRVVPRPRRAEPGPPGPSRNAPSPPHLAGPDELGDSAALSDWWRVDGTSGGGFALGDSVPGFTGGVEIPELLKPPPRPGGPSKPGTAKEPAADGTKAKEPAVEAAPVGESTGRRRRLPPLLTARSNPLLLLAAGLLLAGAVLGSWLALGLGWLIAWVSRRLTPAESKWAVMGLPGLAAASGIVWLWGRTSGRWGDPIAQGHMNDALAQTWPWVVRGAAVASALYLVWRSQRQK